MHRRTEWLRFRSWAMGNFDQAANSKARKISDDSDRRLFTLRRAPRVARKIIIIKHNDPGGTSLKLNRVDDMEQRAWRRLGYILSRNTHVEELELRRCNLDMEGLCEGLQHNQFIQNIYFHFIDLQDNEKLSSLAPFLSHNHSLKNITLRSCNLGSGGIDILSSALSNCSEDTLESLELSGNCFGDIDLDELILALSTSRNLTILSLASNGIGLKGSTSLARLLENQRSNLEYLYLSENSIDNESAIMLADSLAKNTKLRTLCLRGNDRITTAGWSAMLKLVHSSPSIDGVIKSNHNLNNLGMLTDRKKTIAIALDIDDAKLLCESLKLNAIRDRVMKASVTSALGVDNANLLRASLHLNDATDKILVARCKILWSHARGNINLGIELSMVTGAMPRILAWIGGEPNETNAIFVQYHYPNVPKAKLDIIRLNSIYRILSSMPNVCI